MSKETSDYLLHAVEGEFHRELGHSADAEVCKTEVERQLLEKRISLLEMVGCE